MSTSQTAGARARPAASGPGTAPPRPKRLDIQGMRALAVLLVVLYHAGLPVLSGGYVGVDVFFVISGFLMTDHLLRSLQEQGRADLLRFYALRVRRILPMALLVIVVTVAVAWFVVPPLRFGSLVREAVASALYVPNVLFAARGTSYLGSHDPSPFQHYWSLGVEEQFYLLWPLALAVLWWLSRRSPRRLAWLVAALVALSFAGSVVITGISQPYAFFLLPTRAWELGAGALVAVLVVRSREAAAAGRASRLPSVVRGGLSWAGLAAVLAAALLYDDSTTFPGVAAGLPVLGTALLVWAGADTGRVTTTPGAGRLLGTRPLTWVGDVSYSVYLWHWPLLVLPAAAGATVSLPLGLALAALTLPLSWLSTRWFEDPLRRARAHGPRAAGSGAVVCAGLLASVLVAGAVLGTGALAAQRPLTSDRSAAAWDPSSTPVFPDFVPVGLSPGLATAMQDRPVTYDDGCFLEGHDDRVKDGCVFGDVDGERSVVLFGDSHAGNWMPALDAAAAERGMRLVVYTKASCPVADVTPVAQGNLLVSCETWRAEVLRRIAADPPAVVVMGASSGVVLPGPAQTRLERWNAGLARTLSQLPAETRPVFVGENPTLPDTTNACLSAHLDDASACWSSRQDVVDVAWNGAVEKTMTAAGGRYTDFNDLLCDATTCGGIAGSTLLYFDGAHLTATASRALAGAAGERVLDAS